MRALKNLLAVVVILAVAVGIFMWLKATKPTVPTPELSEKVWPVAAQTVQQETLRPQRDVLAHVTVPVLEKFQAPISAWVKTVAVKPHQTVAKGTLLYALDEADILAARTKAQADVADLEAQLKIEQLNLKAQQRLQARKLANDLAVEQLKAKLAQLQARLQKARANLAQVEAALARAKGVAVQTLRIVEVPVSAGERVNPGQVLLTAYAPEALEYEVTLPERVWQRVKGQPQALQLEDGQGHLYSFMRASVQRTPLGVKVWFKAPPAAQLGDLTQATLHLPPLAGVAAIPYSALYGEDTVYLVEKNSRLRHQKVQLEGEVRRNGRTYALVSALVSGLPQGAVVMTTHLPNAIDGLKVKVVP